MRNIVLMPLIALFVVVAHRGGATLAPENSLSAFEAGIQAGADIVELDIHLSADGKVVVCHDETVDRTTDGHGFISSLTFEQLAALHIKSSDGKLLNESIPSLEQVIDLVGNRATILIEIKVYNSSLPGIEQACIDIIRAHKAEKQVIIQSFNAKVLQNCYDIAPDLRYERLIYMPIGFNLKKQDFVASINMNYAFVTPKFVKKVHAAGKEVKVWTLDKVRPKITDIVDGVITNDPRLFKGKRE